MKKHEPILIYNRETGRHEPETVWGERFVRLVYEEAWGRCLAEVLLKRRFFSRFIGLWQDLPFSRGKIARVAERLGIDLDEMEKPVDQYGTFNEFFTRALKKDARPVDTRPEAVISACDARLTALDSVDPERPIEVKGSRISFAALLGDEGLVDRYKNGALLIYRLCPADYHRFHFPEKGIPGPAGHVDGPLHSVHPIALASGLPILDRNLKHRTLLETGDCAGTICMIEIGAMCVGSIVQTFQWGKPVERGEEKGLFRFGGSTVVLFYQRDRIRIEKDILEQSREGIETLVKMGTVVAFYK